jgi:outer membrane protein assembly factor BamE (lipoprotein component of BamABCDE complex)
MRILALVASSLLLAGCAALGDSRPHGGGEFLRVKQGMSQDETLRLLGQPFQTMRFPLSGQTSWDYRYYDAWGYLALFSVNFGPEGAVVGTMSQRLNDGGDHAK